MKVTYIVKTRFNDNPCGDYIEGAFNTITEANQWLVNHGFVYVGDRGDKPKINGCSTWELHKPLDRPQNNRLFDFEYDYDINEINHSVRVVMENKIKKLQSIGDPEDYSTVIRWRWCLDNNADPYFFESGWVEILEE